MRLGAPIFAKYSTPDEWVAVVKAAGYRAAWCPVDEHADEAEVEAYVEAARRADIVIAEVGAWSNPMDPDEAKRTAAIDKCRECLLLAERAGARCCVNISGSRGSRWDGPHPDNLTDETFEMVVETTREIIDAVDPRHTFYTLEPMPWMFPDSPDSYLRLIEAVGRPAFGVHLDPVNMISSPQRYFDNAEFLRECFEKLGGHIRSCHAKDIRLEEHLTVHLNEVRPGLGALDYRTYLAELNKLDRDTPLLLEHLEAEEEFNLAAAHVRGVAKDLGIRL